MLRAKLWLWLSQYFEMDRYFSMTDTSAKLSSWFLYVEIMLLWNNVLSFFNHPRMHQWALKVHVPDASVSKTLTVSGESTVSEVTLKLVELLGESCFSFSFWLDVFSLVNWKAGKFRQHDNLDCFTETTEIRKKWKYHIFVAVLMFRSRWWILYHQNLVE